MATKIQGMYQRGPVFWLRVTTPKDLQAAFYGGKKIAHNASLGTSDPQAARVVAMNKRAELEAQFLRQRRELSPPKVASVTPELRQYILDALMAEEVAMDAAQRMDKTRTHSVHGGVTVGYAMADGALPERPPVPPVSPLHPNAPHVVTGRAAFNAKRMQTVRAALASGNLQVMIPIVDPIAKRLGLAIDYQTPDGAQLLYDALCAYSNAREVAVKRDGGHVVPTPPMPAEPAVTAMAPTVPAPGFDGTAPSPPPKGGRTVKASRRHTPGTVYLQDIKADWITPPPICTTPIHPHSITKLAWSTSPSWGKANGPP